MTKLEIIKSRICEIYEYGDRFCASDVREICSDLVYSTLRRCLQELRDMGFLIFIDNRGEYELTDPYQDVSNNNSKDEQNSPSRSCIPPDNEKLGLHENNLYPIPVASEAMVNNTVKSDEKDGNKPSPDLPEGKKVISNTFNYNNELTISFNRSGKISLSETPYDDGLVKNPEKRRGKEAKNHRERIVNEPPAEDRRRIAERTILEGPDPDVRNTLEEWYGGKCQICHKTFPERDGSPHFVAVRIVERKNARFCDDKANTLCFCAEHFAKWKLGSVESEDIIEQIISKRTKKEDGDNNLLIGIKLCGEPCRIEFNEKHILSLQELIKQSCNTHE